MRPNLSLTVWSWERVVMCEGIDNQEVGLLVMGDLITQIRQS